MATRKKSETQPVISNVNNNTNNVNVHVKVPRTRKPSIKKKEEPNWLLKASIGGIISIGVALAIYYLTTDSEQQHNRPAVIENTRSSTGNI